MLYTMLQNSQNLRKYPCDSFREVGSHFPPQIGNLFSLKGSPVTRGRYDSLRDTGKEVREGQSPATSFTLTVVLLLQLTTTLKIFLRHQIDSNIGRPILRRETVPSLDTQHLTPHQTLGARWWPMKDCRFRRLHRTDNFVFVFYYYFFLRSVLTI